MRELAAVSEQLAGVIEATGASVLGVEAGWRSRGTGVVWSADGLVVTADHVVHREERARVRLADGRLVPAEVVGRDPTTDLAVLRVRDLALSAASWTDSSALRVGTLIVALGRPGRTLRATLGIISVLGEEWQTPAGGRLDRYLEADVRLYPGFSGGPLLDSAGGVLGVNTAGLRRGGSLTVVTPTIRRVAEALVTHGRVRHGYLGVATHSVRLAATIADQLGQERGLLVLEVEPGSPADQGGVLLGDTIAAVDGQPVRYPEELFGLLSGERIGRAAPLRIVRAGTVQPLTITVGERLRRTA
ncbi:MAG TPA: trypsin-like peptidase domain-containing protein [bacterium]|nr:trypsin-like peptidase domain-containing protein [bacterium]